MPDPARLPTTVEKGAIGGPRDKVTVLAAYGGGEIRNVDWPRPKREYNISYGIGDDDFRTVLDFYMTQRGKAYTFLFKDWTDFAGVGEIIGTGDGAETDFQLIRFYDSNNLTLTRPIVYPVADTVAVYVDGVLKTLTTHYTLSAGGIIHFVSAPTAAAVITADFEFDVLVRFDSDVLQIAMQTATAGQVGAVKLVEVFE